jgi:hypothetical protein
VVPQNHEFITIRCACLLTDVPDFTQSGAGALKNLVTSHTGL